MFQNLTNLIFALLFSFILFSSFTGNKDAAENSIKELVEQYKQAYNSQDAKALSLLFTEDGQSINPETGNVIKGRSALETTLKERFAKQPITTLESKTTNIEFPSDDEAVITGTFLLKNGEKETKEKAFRAYFKKENDPKSNSENNHWLLDELREIDIAKTANHYQHLKELDWLIGTWLDEDDDVEIHTSNQWDSSKNLIIGKFSLITEGKKELEGMQIIAWDPIQNKIRSWIFDSDGAFGEASWIKKEKSWVVQTSQTLSDGSLASATNVFTPLDQNTFEWKSLNRESGGNLLPDIAPVLVKRVKNEKQL